MLSLSDILTSAKMESAGFVLIDLAGAAKVAFERTDRVCLHYVISGQAVLDVDGVARTLTAGDFVCLRRSGRHFLSTGHGGAGQRTNILRVLTPSDTVERLRFGSGQPDCAARLLSGSFRLNWQDGAPVHALMPDMMLLRPDRRVTGSIAPPPMALAACEGVGAGAFATSFMHALFIQAVRADVHQRLGEGSADFSDIHDYASLRHFKVAAALRLIDREFAQAWTAPALAQRVGMSRSAFASAFRDTVGASPMARLAAVRLAEARRRMQDGASVGAAARAVGYASPAAFSRAFHRHFGQPPAAARNT